MTNRYRTIVVVHVLLRRPGGHVLLMERANTGSADGQLCLPGGHLEEGESVIAGAIRETGEETGVELDEAGLEFAHVVHRRDGRDDPRIGFFFVADRWHGEPTNREPRKCARLLWADPANPPVNTLAYTAAALARITKHQPFSLDGWSTPTEAANPLSPTR